VRLLTYTYYITKVIVLSKEIVRFVKMNVCVNPINQPIDDENEALLAEDRR